MWYSKAFFKYTTGIILILLILFLLGEVRFILSPIKDALMVVSLPIIVTLLLYYLLRPLVRFMVKHNLPKILSVLVSFFIVIGILVLIGALFGNTIINESNELINSELPRVIEQVENTITDFVNSDNFNFISIEEATRRGTNFIERIIPVLSESILSGIASIANAITALLLVPFILFYFLKDDTIFANNIINLFPSKYKDEAKDLFVDIDKTLSSYIIGQAMVCLVIGILMYLGYLIIGLDYALALAFFSMFSAIIPFIGPIIGVLPALLVGLSYDLFMVAKILIVMIIVQQLEGNLITPQIMGRRIHTHPVMILMVILVSASLFGFIGILLAIPAYAVLKVLIKNSIEIFRLLRRQNS